jgi:two-component system, chemotaxis family, chemotaxis protein CheY
MRKIVIAEDDSVTRLTEKKIVESLGHCAVLCVNGRTAWELLDANPDTALIVLDIEMPEMDGLTLLHKIRQEERFDNIEVLVVSGRCSLEEVSLLLQHGADGFQPKPIKPQTLAENIKLLLPKET